MLSSGPIVIERMDISPAKPKRKREESKYEVDLGRARGANPAINEYDCFQETFSGHLLTANNTVRSSWLTTEHCWTHESVLRVAKRHYGVISLQEQIKATQHQLVQLKRRFGPTAEQCALTWNNQYSGEETSASHEFQEARSMCNPFEGLHLDGMFLNRAGNKLANIDALVNFNLTNCNNDGEFTFVDLCGAPGGFSEYLIKRFQSLPSIHSCRGWGMSLRGMNEHGSGAYWKLQHVIDNTIATGTHVQYKFCNGSDGTGDIYHWQNVEALAQQINNKVSLVVADGGFDAQRNAECQEEVACKIVVCQAAAALTLLCKGGTFVMKMFGFQTRVIRVMMKQLFSLFDKVTVVKPISSRPASAERYVVFEGYKGTTSDFDGLKWQSSILLGNAASRIDDNSELESNLFYCLDECDRDVLQLNQKACFEILSYMERKTREVSAQSGATFSLEKPEINMHVYKLEWRLA